MDRMVWNWAGAWILVHGGADATPVGINGLHGRSSASHPVPRRGILHRLRTTDLI